MKAPTQKPPITERITAFLATVAEATAGQIARAIGETDYPSRITSALNTLRTDALIECEKKKGKGNELWYWLSAAPDSQSEKIPLVEQKQHVAEPGDADDADDPQYLAADYEMPPADPDLLASANRMLHDRLERIAHVLRGCGLPELANVQASEDLQVSAAALAGAYITTAADLRAAQAALKAEQAELDTERLAREALQEQLDAAQDVKDAATGYLVRAPKRRLRLLTNPENARTAALAAARTAGRADVLALVPVGRAVRGAEWKAAHHG